MSQESLQGGPPTLPPGSNGPQLLASDDDAVRLRELNRMKMVATSLLFIAFFIFVLAKLWEDQYPWLGFVRATAEAAMVGALADWFAVTALFRHPLGLKIPHTAIIPTRKDRIGRTFGRFVQHNFLSADIVTAKLKSMQITRQVATWLSRPENGRLLMHHATNALAAAVEVINDEDVQRVIERNVQTRLRQARLAPLLGRALDLLRAGDRQRELLSGTLALVARLLEENEEPIRARINEELPWWIPVSVDGAIYRRLVVASKNTLAELQEDPEHPLHAQFSRLLDQFTDDLQNSEAISNREEMLKEEFLEHPLVRDFASSLWRDAKQSLLEPGTGGEAAINLREPLEMGLEQFAGALLNDAVLQQKVDSWIEGIVLYLVREYGYEVEQLISQTIHNWDAQATSRKIELQVGRDLQFIRINGTVVGGLAGLFIYTFSTFL